MSNVSKSMDRLEPHLARESYANRWKAEADFARKSPWHAYIVGMKTGILHAASSMEDAWPNHCPTPEETAAMKTDGDSNRKMAYAEGIRAGIRRAVEAARATAFDDFDSPYEAPSEVNEDP